MFNFVIHLVNPLGCLLDWLRLGSKGGGYKAMSNFVIVRHFLGAGPDGDDLGGLLRRSTTW